MIDGYLLIMICVGMALFLYLLYKVYVDNEKQIKIQCNICKEENIVYVYILAGINIY